jgi:hypothetical protein
MTIDNRSDYINYRFQRGVKSTVFPLTHQVKDFIETLEKIVKE